MQFKRLGALCGLAVMGAILLSGCHTSSSKSYTFEVSTGDKIKVSLDTSTGLSLSQKDGTFSVTKDDEKLLDGMLVTKETYDDFAGAKGQQGMTVLEDSEKDGNTYYMYEYEGSSGTEDNFIIWIDNSNTGAILASLAGKEKAKDAFEKLVITKE